MAGRIIRTGGVNGSTSYSTNGLNQYTSVGGVSASSDPKGNLTSLAGNSYTFGAENTLTTGGGSSFWNDALHRLTYLTTSALRFDYDGDRLVGIYNGSNTLLRRFVYGPGENEPAIWYEGTGTADRRYLDADERGSIIRVTNHTGGTSAINTYDEYGNPGAGNSGRFQYTGQAWLSEIGKYYYRNRIYAPTIGRFMQPDPTGYDAGMNLYAYVDNDPVNETDPSGLQGTAPIPCPGGYCTIYSTTTTVPGSGGSSGGSGRGSGSGNDFLHTQGAITVTRAITTKCSS